MENKIDAEFTAADRDKVLGFISQIRAQMPFLVDLSTEERKSLPKMGDKRRSFVTQALTLAEQDDSFLPRSFDVPEMRKDVELTENIYPVAVALMQLAEFVDDTYTLAGSEAYAGGLVVYNSAQRSGKGEALDNLVDLLGKSFARKSKGKSGSGGDEEPDK